MVESTELTPQQQFEEKLLDRLRKDIGELLPDDVLRGMVEKAMQKMLFEPRKFQRRKNTRGGTEEVDLPSFLQERVEKLARERTHRMVSDWFEKSAGLLEEEMLKCVTAAMPLMFAKSFFSEIDRRSSGALVGLQDAVQRQFVELINSNPGMNVPNGTY